MPKWTKQDIDALVGGLSSQPNPRDRTPETLISGYWYPVDGLRSGLYLAAGLTADGERKPAKVRVTVLVRPDGSHVCVVPEWFRPVEGYCLVAGDFTPDGDE